jgi:hypothetical protein
MLTIAYRFEVVVRNKSLRDNGLEASSGSFTGGVDR